MNESKRLTPCRAIKEFCHTACDGKTCENRECPLFVYRHGHNPGRTGIHPLKKSIKRRENGKFSPSRDGKKQILQTVTDGSKRIRVIVEDVT